MPVYSTSFFFFQAEDGIRDYKVTGVQTCALPISPWSASAIPARRRCTRRRSPRRRALRTAWSPTARGGGRSIARAPGRRRSARGARRPRRARADRKSGVEGKRGDLGGRRIIKKKK